MWIFTTSGFVAAAEDPADSGAVLVSAVDRRSLEYMLGAVELAGNAEGRDLEPLEVQAGADGYPWRVRMPRGTFTLWLGFEALNFVTYREPFPVAVGQERGQEWQSMVEAIRDRLGDVGDVP